jgi:PST family polysaccharide transporter
MLRNLSPGARQVLGNTGWLMADRVVRLGLGLLIGVWVARYLGRERFGSLSFALAFNGLFAAFMSLGLESIVVRELVADVTHAPEILGSALALRLSSALVATLLSFATIRVVQPNDPMAVLLVSLLSIGFFFQAFDTIDSYFQSQVRSRYTVWAKNGAFLGVTILRVVLIHYRAPLWAFAVAQVSELAVGALGLVLCNHYKGGRISVRNARFVRAVQLLKQSWPLILTGMAITIYMRIDMVMLKVMRGDDAVGIYAIATRLSEVWYFIPGAIVSSVSPAIMRAKNDPVLYFGRIEKLFATMTLIALVLGSGIAVSAHWIVGTLYGPAFLAAAPILAVHVWASVFVFLGVAQTPFDLSQNLLPLYFYRTLAGAVANVLLNLILIPRYSAMGAAIATVLSQALAAVFANALSPRTRPILRLQLRALLPDKLWAPVSALRFDPPVANDAALAVSRDRPRI